jgi:uncharacterized membrane protein YgcG
MLWFIPVFFDVWQTNKWRSVHQTKVLQTLIDSTASDGSLTVEDIRQLVSAMDQSPRGAAGLTQSLLALIIASLVAVALVTALVSTATDSGDLRKTIVTSLLSILATVSGFYFGARTAQTSTEQATKPPVPSPGDKGGGGSQGGGGSRQGAAGEAVVQGDTE